MRIDGFAHSLALSYASPIPGGQAGLAGMLGMAGTENVQGEDQKKVRPKPLSSDLQMTAANDRLRVQTNFEHVLLT